MTADALKLAEVTSNPSSHEADYRVMPRNEEVEQALLGALLINNKALEKVSEFLRPEHFYNPVHGRIFEAIFKFVERGQDASPITLKNFFEKDADLAHVGGGQYLSDLAANVISVVNVADYGQTVYELHLRRALVTLGEDVVNDAYDHNIDLSASQQIEQTEKRLFDLATAGDYKGGFVAFHKSLANAINHAQLAYQREGQITGVTTGLIDLDKLMGGLQNSDLIILAGRPAMGKTALATNIALSAARARMERGTEGAVVGFFSLEMSAEQLATRILADMVSVSSDKIRRGEVRDTDFNKFVEASQTLSQLPLFIDDTPGQTISAIRTRARRLQRQHKLGMIVIDYLQLIQGSGRGSSADNRVQEISEITRGLKTLAKELNVPVLALSQLSRQVESRDNKRPMLSDLRESGSIEQDADVVMFVYRDEYYLKQGEPGRRPEENDDKFNQRYADWQKQLEASYNIAECIISKQRHGPTGTVKLHFEGEFTRFSNLENYRVDSTE
jgi:replicative DNA helicase